MLLPLPVKLTEIDELRRNICSRNETPGCESPVAHRAPRFLRRSAGEHTGFVRMRIRCRRGSHRTRLPAQSRWGSDGDSRSHIGQDDKRAEEMEAKENSRRREKRRGDSIA